MKVSEFDYYLPEELIAQQPVVPRDRSRLMVVHKKAQMIQHAHFNEIINFLSPGDVLVLNNTRVLPARLIGVKKDTGAKIEVVLLKRLNYQQWEVLVKPGKKVKDGSVIVFGNGELSAESFGATAAGGRIFNFTFTGIFEEKLHLLGKMPLPPYIKQELKDSESYQTVYAEHEGSAAAPTAGLHFTHTLLEQISAKGIIVCNILLHVGLGTFRPVQVEQVEHHKMHAEYYEIFESSANKIQAAVREGRRVIAVGTTTVRTLETVMREYGQVQRASGWTDIFIYPGFNFKVVKGMITNFHLPKSSLIMLVSAFMGKDLTMKAYTTAVQEKYRFFSFGDAMLIV